MAANEAGLLNCETVQEKARDLKIKLDILCEEGSFVLYMTIIRAVENCDTIRKDIQPLSLMRNPFHERDIVMEFPQQF